MKKLFILLLALSLTGCATKTVISQANFQANGKDFLATTVSVNRPVGTELQHLMVMDEENKIVSSATAQGRGIVAGMTDGALPAALQAAGMVGAAAVWPSDTYNNNSSGGISASGSESAGGEATATGGSATATAKQLQAQQQSQCQTQSVKNNVKNVNRNVNQNHNNNKNKGGWTPPGQDKK